VIDLYNRVQVGAKVVVLPQTSVAARAHQMAMQSYASQPVSPARATWDRIRRTGVY
jgi:hypothetical protein